MLPSSILRVWALGLLALGLVAGAIFCGHEWYQASWRYDPALARSVFDPQFGWNAPTMLLAAATLAGLIALNGKLLVRGILSLAGHSRKRKTPGESPYLAPVPREQKVITGPDGSELKVKFYGPAGGVPVILSHGWGFDSDEWNYLKQELSSECRLIVWDEPGLGHSSRPTNRDYSLENLARDLESVTKLAGDRPAILLGHSIGGMITLTFCRLFPEALGQRISGLVLTHTTYTNPVKTAKGAALYRPIEKPILVPLLYLTILLSPLVWLMNWLSYRNGSAHLSTKLSSYAKNATWEQIDFAASFQAKASPAVVARGMLGMMKYDASEILRKIRVPTLVVAADQDTLTKPEASEHIHREIAGSELLTLSPAKHLGLLEHYRSYAANLLRFIRAVPRVA